MSNSELFALYASNLRSAERICIIVVARSLEAAGWPVYTRYPRIGEFYQVDGAQPLFDIDMQPDRIVEIFGSPDALKELYAMPPEGETLS